MSGVKSLPFSCSQGCNIFNAFSCLLFSFFSHYRAGASLARTEFWMTLEINVFESGGRKDEGTF